LPRSGKRSPKGWRSDWEWSEFVGVKRLGIVSNLGGGQVEASTEVKKNYRKGKG